MQLFTVTMSWTLMPLGWSRRRLPADSWWLSILDLQPLQRDETQRWDEVYYKVNRIKSYMFLIFVATSSKIKMVIFGPCPLAPTISDTISGQGQRPGWMGGWQLCSVVWWRWMVVSQLFMFPLFSHCFLSLLSFFSPFSHCCPFLSGTLIVAMFVQQACIWGPGDEGQKDLINLKILFITPVDQEGTRITVGRKPSLFSFLRNKLSTTCTPYNVRYHTLIIGSNIMWCVKNRKVFNVN